MIHVIRKPLSGTVAQTALEHGTGGLNIDQSRVASTGDHMVSGESTRRSGGMTAGDERKGAALGMFAPGSSWVSQQDPSGRWPANLILEHLPECRKVGRAEKVTDWECVERCPIRMLDEQSGERKSAYPRRQDLQAVAYAGTPVSLKGTTVIFGCEERAGLAYSDSGGASRYFKQVGDNSPPVSTGNKGNNDE